MSATLIRDLVEIPERVHHGDFVLNLSDGVKNPAQTLRSYVVTEQLATSFDDALTFIQSAVQGRTSKATYLHGSFGSGKSHFMAVLHLLLMGDPDARAIPELQTVLANHDWMAGRKFLLAPYHMIGARSMESAVLGGYVRHVHKLHPDAPVPAVYLAEGLFSDANKRREQTGDEAFFSGLRAGGGDDDEGWGELAAGWDAASYDAAVVAEADDPQRQRLVGDLLSAYFTSYAGVAEGSGEGFVTLDRGLSIISRHASDLGYDALILFLDELILWLASQAGDAEFVQREGPKLAKLVESEESERPAPIVSFVARQRSLQELVGGQLAGVDHERLDSALQWWEGRFHQITLDDRNLPTIIERRLLRPVSDDAKRELDAAFERTARVRQEVMDTLLAREADKAMFRQVYPFSPALVQALVALSSVLQRERTALRALVQLLVDRRDHLRVGDIIPVGDLWDVLARGAEPVSSGLRVQFEAAAKLWEEKLRPAIERAHGVNLDDMAQGAADSPQAQGALADARIAKTLLLAELVPKVESLRDLTASKLAALNHGTIRSPIPGQEATVVLQRVKAWSRDVGEIVFGGDDSNPSIRLRLSGVDIEPLLDAVASQDNPGNRRRTLRKLLFGKLGLEQGGELFTEYRLLWRGTQRAARVLYGNVREMPPSNLEARDDEWLLVIDYPFDEAGFTPQDDVDAVESFNQDHPSGTRSLLWLPSFFSVATLNDLGVYIRADYLLTGDNFDRHASMLAPDQRRTAHTLLQSRRDNLRGHLVRTLSAAYGLGTADKGALDDSHGHKGRIVSLSPEFQPSLPATGELGAALEAILRSALEAQFPAHPKLADEPEIKRGLVRKALEHVEKALADPRGAVAVDRTGRQELAALWEPMELGKAGETHFSVTRTWYERIERKRAEVGAERVTVGDLRGWIDPPTRRSGLPKLLSDLIILTYVAQADRQLRLHGGPYAAPEPGRLPDELELRAAQLPDEDRWQEALGVAEELLGVTTISPLLRASNLDRLTAEVVEALKSRSSVGRLSDVLRITAGKLKIDGSNSARVEVAAAAAQAHASLADLDGGELVEALATIDPGKLSMATVGHAMKHADAQLKTLARDEAWDLFATLGQVRDDREGDAKALLAELEGAFVRTELAGPLDPVVSELFPRALRILVPPKPKRPVAALGSGQETAIGPDRWADVRREIDDLLEGNPQSRLTVTWHVGESKS